MMTNMLVKPVNKKEFIFLTELFNKMQIAYKPISYDNDATGTDLVGQDAHHVFDKALGEKFSKFGLNFWDYGAAWESTAHRANSYLWQQTWRKFFDSPFKITRESIFEKLIQMKFDSKF